MVIRRVRALWLRHSLLQSVSTLFSVSLLGKGVTFFREALTAYYFGTTVFKDGFVAVFSLTALIYSPFLESVTKLTVPKYLSFPKPRQFVLVFSIQLGLLCLAVLLMSVPLKSWILNTVYSGMLPPSFSVLSTYFFVMMLYTILFLYATFFSQILNAAGYYGLSECRNILFSGVSLGFMVGKVTLFGLHPLVGGYLGGVAAMTTYMVAVVAYYRLGTIRMTVSEFKDIWKTSGVFWIKFGGVSAVGSCSILPAIVVQQRLTALGPQVLSAHDYALRCFGLISALFAPVVLTPVYTKIANLAAAKQVAWRFLKRVALFIVIGSLVIAVGIFLVGRPLLALFFLRGAFDRQSLDLTFSLLAAYSWTLGIFSLNLLLEYLVLAYGLNKTYLISVVLHYMSALVILATVTALGYYVAPLSLGIGGVVSILVRLWMVRRHVLRHPDISHVL